MSGYLTTNSNGEFSGTVTGLTSGQKIITATFEGDSEYNPSTDNKHITIIDPNIVLSLATSKETIIMGDSCNIIATLTKNGLPYVNQEIEYQIMAGSTIIDSDSDFTNNAGEITIPYTGTGAGDISIIASYNTVLEETISIEDCIDYELLIDNTDENKWTIPSAVTSSSAFGYSSDGWQFGNATSYSRIIHKTSITTSFSVEFTLTSIYQDGIIHYIYSNGTTPNAGIVINRHLNNVNFLNQTYNYTYTTGDKFKIEWMSDGTAKLYINDVLIGSGTHSVVFPTNVEFHTGSNRNCRIKDLKIKKNIN